MKNELAAEPKSAPEAPKGPEKYEIEDAVRTLIRAEEIKADAKLMAACSAHLSKQKKHIDSVSGLRKKAAELDSEEASPAEEDEA